MASYRPKSLNELNNLYGKSMAAQTAIKNNGSAITDSGFDKNREYSQAVSEDLQAAEKTAAQIASDELSDALSDFIKNFGEADTAAAEKPAPRQPLPIAKAIKSSAPVTPKTDRSAEHPISKVDTTKSAQEDAPKAKKEKPVLMRNSERSELLDDYMKIMNDEDDDMEFLKNIVKKKKKNKKDKHQGSPLFEEEKKSDEPTEENRESENKELSEDLVEASEINEQPAEKETEVFSSFYNDESEPEYSADEDEQTPSQPAPVKKGKKIFLQIFLMLILLIVLIGAVAVGLMKVVVGVDSGNAFMDKYYVFTADRTFTEAEINEGDLVITEDKAFAQNDVFAYTKENSDETVYAVKGLQLDSGRFMAHSDNEVELIYADAVKGTVIKTVPSVGAFVSILMDNFIIVISALVSFALILILVIALAFRSKSGYTIDDSEEAEEDEDEEESEEADDEYEADGEYSDEDTDEEYSEKENGLFSSID